jgi:hypothetical protein
MVRKSLFRSAKRSIGEDPRIPLSEESRDAARCLGYGAPKRRGRPPAIAIARGNGTTQTKGRKGKAKAKYRDPKTNETWSGRGRMASWLTSKQDVGEKIEKYLV